MKARKRRYEIYTFYDHTGIALHLEKMAEKGWLLEKITNYIWTYRRIEPKKLHFSVFYDPKASEFDPEPSEDQKVFFDFCEHTGWIYATSSSQMQIFYNEQENPTPIETDPVLEIDTLHRAMKKTYLPTYLILAPIGVLQLAMLISQLISDPIRLLASVSLLFGGLAWALLLLLCITELSGYYLWRSRAKKPRSMESFLKPKDTPDFKNSS